MKSAMPELPLSPPPHQIAADTTAISKHPVPARVLALDFGVKKMGIATGTKLNSRPDPQAAVLPEQTHAESTLALSSPHSVFPMDNGHPNWEQLRALIDQLTPELILVGLPLNMDGTDSHLSKRATKFAKRLSHRLKEVHRPIPVKLIDERLSSAEARSQHKAGRDQIIDAYAAQLLVDAFFNQPDQLIEL
jgi:putative Holliday junction resolvase